MSHYRLKDIDLSTRIELGLQMLDPSRSWGQVTALSRKHSVSRKFLYQLCNQMREAMEEQLEEYGIEMPTREEMIDNRIEHTQQRLEILERTKELIQENSEITKEEIRETIQEEFDLELPNGEGRGRPGSPAHPRG